MNFLTLLSLLFISNTTQALINAVPINKKIPIVQINFKNGSHVCSGIFIDDQTILTAAHCISDKKTWEGFSLEVDSILDQDGNKVSVISLKTIPHPDFAFHVYGNEHDLGIIKTTPYKFEGSYPKVSISSSINEGILYACGRTNFLDKKRLCQQGEITYHHVFNQIISYGRTSITDTPGVDVSVAPNDSGGVLVAKDSNSIIGVIWGTWLPLLKDVPFILNPNFITMINEENLRFIQGNLTQSFGSSITN